MDPIQIDPSQFVDLAAAGPWYIAAFLGYRLFARAAADLCSEVPRWRALAERVAGALEKLADKGENNDAKDSD